MATTSSQQGTGQLTGTQLYNIVFLVVGLAGGALFLLLGGLVVLAVIHDGSVTSDVVSIATGLAGFITGLIPFLIREVGNAAGVVGQGNNNTTVNTPSPVVLQPANGAQATVLSTPSAASGERTS